jgi:hypothetical protein
MSIANCMGLADCPPVLATLNYMDLRMVSKVHCFATLIHLPRGQSASKGIAISFAFAAVEYVTRLPR